MGQLRLSFRDPIVAACILATIGPGPVPPAGAALPLGLTGYRAGRRTGRTLAGASAGSLAGAVSGAVGGAAYVLFGKPALNLLVGLLLGAVGGAIVGTAGGWLSRRRLGRSRPPLHLEQR